MVLRVRKETVLEYLGKMRNFAGLAAVIAGVMGPTDPTEGSCYLWMEKLETQHSTR